MLLVIIGGGFLSNLLDKVESVDDQIRLQQRQAPVPSSRVGIASEGAHRTIIPLAGRIESQGDHQLELQLTFVNADPYQTVLIESIELFDQAGVSVALLATGQNAIAPRAVFNKTLSLQYMLASSVASCVISWRINDWAALPISYLVLTDRGATTPVRQVISGQHRAVL
nr:DUF3124 domain-containing protein [Neiella litorisoli]